MPLEAAVHRGDPEIVQLLKREGAVLEPATAWRLACAAAARGRPKIATMLGRADSGECPK